MNGSATLGCSGNDESASATHTSVRSGSLALASLLPPPPPRSSLAGSVEQAIASARPTAAAAQIDLRMGVRRSKPGAMHTSPYMRDKRRDEHELSSQH